MAADPAPMVEMASEALLTAPRATSAARDGLLPARRPADLEEAPVTLQKPSDIFPENAPSGLKITMQEPVSTFSVEQVGPRLVRRGCNTHIQLLKS